MSNAKPLLISEDLPAGAGDRQDWLGLVGDATALAIAETARQHNAPMILVTTGTAEAEQLRRGLRFFGIGDIELMPDWEVLPYDVFSPHQDITSERLRALHRLPRKESGVVIVPTATLMQRIAPPSFLEATVVRLARGQRLALESMRGALQASGYRCVSEVLEHGEFAVRGSILDLYPMGAEAPFRLDLFDDEIDTIRTFDPETQRSLERLDSVELLPAHEFPTDEEGIKRFRRQYRARFEGDPTASPIYQSISDGHIPNGIESYLPLFFEEAATLFDYLPAGTLAVQVGAVDDQLDAEWAQINERYEQRRHDRERPVLAPASLYLDPDAVRQGLRQGGRIDIPADPTREVARSRDRLLGARPLPDLTVASGDESGLSPLRRFVEEFNGSVLLTAETAGRREALRERLQAGGLSVREFNDWPSFLAAPSPLGLTVAPLDTGFRLPEAGLAVVPESALFGERAEQRRRRKSAPERDPDAIIRDLTDLRAGAPVVHEQHGIGRYQGLQTLDVDGVATEFLTLEYAGGDKLYVPVASLHLISRYTGAEDEGAPLHRLGSGQWEKAKRRAAEKARDVAAELLDIYARREAQQGEAHEVPVDEYSRFAAQFPFEETPDQQTAIHAVLQDLQQARPMDRVVCGDVGFGKTEVAMRAAFAGVQSGRQVAVLVPTTLLCQQHFQNFTDRFADWPVRIEQISRFQSAQAQARTLEALADGRVDIVIGTHKLLQKSVRFKRLGLMIIDEEHRFGVRQKEALKRLRANVDVLTLTATPIPRTLNMSLAGLRDLSIIATPPARRLAVKTFVNEWDEATIREACLRELHRGGQVYFLHNDVQSIQRVAEELATLLPEARVRTAHGQMPERELERVMLDFYHQRFNILVCTTIIESGIDVPTANTIVINRADRLGLAQLHQLRGRVGRSHHRAYAYLIAPPRRSQTPDAVKRLDAIASLEDLGIGFALASHDLEIRGAGELLGEGQSGQIHEVGFNLYNDLLDRAVQSLKSGKEPALEQPLEQSTDVDLHIPALLPEDYLPDVHTRLVLYKRIASARGAEALRELQVEMIDRFGLIPAPARNLLEVARLRQQAQSMGIQRLEVGPGGGIVQFGEAPQVDAGALVRMVQEQPAVYRLEGQERLRFQRETESAQERIDLVEQLLASMALREAA
ncbi:transcription-repair coupling factor [Spiribacter onubensis]|uniref:Transcription-repair-coupling factor n=1 Tax=Spiribacter onubensis TaxID=3122420 RepID=A0ABV3S840_9GAMM